MDEAGSNLKTGKKNLFCEDVGDAQPPKGAAGRLHKALARLTDPKYVEDTQGWRLITICVKATRDAAGSGAQ